MGVSSLIAILVILLLVVFSVLSITTSRADLLLSQRSSESIKAFYDADASAEDKMAEIAAVISRGGNWKAVVAHNGCTVSSDKEQGTDVSYTIPIDEYRNLDVKLFVDTDGELTRTIWQVVPAKNWVADENLNLHNP
jgi:hypothetical protein